MRMAPQISTEPTFIIPTMV
nr:unnamed protein product [Callosobruchus analis]